MNEAELSKYCCEKGIYPDQIKDRKHTLVPYILEYIPSAEISMKIILSIILSNILILAVLGGTIGYLVANNVGAISEDYAKSQVGSNIGTIDQDFKQVESLVKGLSAQIASEVDINAGKADIQYLRDFADDYESKFQAIGLETQVTNSIFMYFNVGLFGDAADCWVYGDAFERQPMIEASYYDTHHDWYNIPIDQGVTQWTFPYLVVSGDAAGQLVSSFVTPIEQDGQIIGLLGMDLDLREIADTLGQVQLYDTGYLYMMAPNGDVISHPRIEWKDTDGDGQKDTAPNILDSGDFQSLLDDMAANDFGLIDYERDDGSVVISAYGHLSNGWIIASSIPTSEVNSIMRNLILVLTIVTTLSLAISATIALLIVAFFNDLFPFLLTKGYEHGFFCFSPPDVLYMKIGIPVCIGIPKHKSLFIYIYIFFCVPYVEVYFFCSKTLVSTCLVW